MGKQIEEKNMIVKVANLYYHEGLTQSQISKQVGMSRPIISKLLQKAKETGVVEIFIRDETLRTVEIEQKLENVFGLKEVVVVPVDGVKAEGIKTAVAGAGAHYLSRQLGDVKRLGISWGTTIAELVQQYSYEKRENIKIIPLEGGIGRNFVEIHANHLAYELAKKMHGTCSYLYAPAILESSEMRDNFLAMADIRSVLDEGAACELAVIGIGNPLKESTLQKIGYLDNADLTELCQAGAVGDIGFRFFDKQGQAINHPFNERVVGISLQQLKNIPLVIAVTEGSYKIESIIGVLNSRLIDVLIIDEPSAVKIVKEIKEEG